jgi:hypothetical protein
MAQAEYTTAVLADSPAAFWKLDEASGLPQDSSGNARHFTTTTGTPTYQQAGPFTGAYGILLQTTTNEGFTRAVFDTATDNVTIEAWLRQADPVSWFLVSNGTHLTDGFTVAHNGANVVVTAGGTTVLSSVPLGTDLVTYKQIVALRRSGTWEIYKDGDLFNTGSTASISTPTGSFKVGIAGSFAAGSVVSNVSYYATAISAARIRAHYEAAIDYQQKTLNTGVRSNLVLA